MAMQADRGRHSSRRNRWIGVLLVVALFPLGESLCAAKDERVRPGILAKRGWYPENPEKLSSSIDAFLAGVAGKNRVEANGPSSLPVRAVIVPHAGHAYSGRTAAYAYKALADSSYKRVVMLGPTHSAHFRGGSIAPVEAYETPLGKVPLDREACDLLLKSALIQEHASAHTDEHCLEIQLPFVQRTLPGVKIIPILIGDLEPSDCLAMADTIRPLLDEETLVLVSSDFTHQGNRFRYVPYRKETPEEEIPQIVRALDFYAVNQIINGNLSNFWAFLDRTRLTICGRNAIKILLAALPAQTQAGVLRYETSSDMTGDYRESVSYCSIVFYNKPGYLNEEEQAKLLTLARQRLADTFDAGKTVKYKPAETALTERMREKRGVFVTLQKEGRLRGCIGILEPVMTLHEAVADRVIRSAFADHRFSPLQEEELKEIEIEISVMTPLRSVPSHEDIVLGRDGIVVEKRGKSAIYLPQVALDQGWDVDETLGHLCEKAGLVSDAWKEGCSFKTFQAQVFGERFKSIEGAEQ